VFFSEVLKFSLQPYPLFNPKIQILSHIFSNCVSSLSLSLPLPHLCSTLQYCPQASTTKKPLIFISRVISQSLSTLQRKKREAIQPEGLPLCTSMKEGTIPRRRPLCCSSSTDENASYGFKTASDGKLGFNNRDNDDKTKQQ
ncbi:unnamed protein product, partial [Prunus brigantina]